LRFVVDWAADKDSIPWFWPSINGNLSKITENDWLTTPGDTNLNESSHTLTNKYTGTHLTLLEAIRRFV
jgi:Sec7-like guanine-nucleotide exchange factor